MREGRDCDVAGGRTESGFDAKAQTTAAEAPETMSGWRLRRQWLLDIGLLREVRRREIHVAIKREERECCWEEERECCWEVLTPMLYNLLSPNPSHPSLILRLKIKLLTSH